MKKDKKKIILVGTSHPFRGGLAAFNERLATEFQNEGNEVIIYTFKLQYPDFLFPGKTQYADWDAPKNLEIRRKVNSINPFNWIKVGREIKKQRPDMIVFCYWMSFMAPCYGTIARMVKSTRSKNFALVHNMIPHETTVLDKLFPGYFVRSMDGFVAMADAVKKDIENIGKKDKHINVSPHPVYDHYGDRVPKQEAADVLGLDVDTSYVLFFGIVRAYKGLDLLLNAFGELKPKEKNIKLIIAGEFYDDEKQYQDLMKDLNIESQVIVKNEFISEARVKYYFSVCDIVVQPYKSATQSGVTQIAYHFEKPMVVTDVGGLKEVVPHNKVGYVTPPDATEISAVLVDFFEKHRREEFEKNVKVEKKRFLWNKMTNNFYTLYATTSDEQK